MLCTILATGLAQDQQATTDDGQKVILKPDFTWKYLKEDSTKVPDRAKIAISNEQNNYDCKYKINEVDEFTNSKKVVLEPSTLIKYRLGQEKSEIHHLQLIHQIQHNKRQNCLKIV